MFIDVCLVLKGSMPPRTQRYKKDVGYIYPLRRTA